MTNLQPSGSADPNPAGNVTSSAFERLDTRLQHFLWAQKWGALRPIQEAAIHALLDFPARDVVLAAPTASGKTEAAFLPLCTRLLQKRHIADFSPGIQLLYISPLKALINDQWGRLDALCEALEVPVHRWHGDVSQTRKADVFKRPSGVLLITPESLEALFMRHGTQIARLFATVDSVVVDELHAFFGSERGRQLQSLLHRIEVVCNQRVRRVGLSATLADLTLAAEFLRSGQSKLPDAKAILLSPPAGAQEIQAQIRGYLKPPPSVPVPDEVREESTNTLIAGHLFKVLRGHRNLVFANRRAEVEEFANRLARMCESHGVPQEFWAHHGNLSREIRYDVESRLKEAERPATAVCTSTLELGIDIGAMYSVAQLGAAPSVAALRQRMGRSGRRAGEPCRLRVYVREETVNAHTPLLDTLHLETFQAVAQFNLLLQGWVESPNIGGLHLSTLLQQCLSVIAERGGIKPAPLFHLLCKTGPFANIDSQTFADFLRVLHGQELVAQMEDGTLLLGSAGERLTDHYTFYAAFATEEEYRLVAGGRTLGTLPVAHPLVVGAFLIYAGKRWRVQDVDEKKRVVQLEPAGGGQAPAFGGSGIFTEAPVRAEMRRLYESSEIPPFLDKTAQALFAEGRDNYARYGLHDTRFLTVGDETHVFLWSSDRAATTLQLECLRRGIGGEQNGVCVTLRTNDPKAVQATLTTIARDGFAPATELAALVKNAEQEKHDRYLSPALLARDYATRFLDVREATTALQSLHG
jgi:ATP-dependent Lhr-like helicase